jgi:predicted esterase
MKRLFALAAGLLASACCTSLPKLPAKRIAPPSLPATHERITRTHHDWRDEKRGRDVPVTIHAPAGVRAPVVIFSHGIGEDRDSYAWLGEALAHHGFLAVHVTHAGTDKAMLQRGYRHLYNALKDRQNWIDRSLDVSFVLDQLARRDDADLSRVAVAGHSAGAFTAFAVAGVRFHDGNMQRDERVKLIIPMSMPRMDGIISDYDVGIPVLNITGTCDTSLLYRTFPRHRRIPFESSSGQHLVTIEGVNHDTFSAPRDRHHALIAALTIAFLRGPSPWLDEPGVGEVGGVRVSVERK